MKNLFSKLFGSFSSDEKLEDEIVCIGAETSEESLRLGLQALHDHAEKNGYDLEGADFYCGICGWVPVSQFANHSH